MKKKYLIIIANYYEDIAKGLLKSALKLIPKCTFYYNDFQDEMFKVIFCHIEKSDERL